MRWFPSEVIEALRRPPRSRGRRAAIVRLVRFTSATVIIAILAGVAMRLRVNLTRSLPLGLYRTVQSRAIARGSIVLVCLPERIAKFARERGYLWRGICPGDTAPVGKLVLAVAGDTVRLAESGLRVNGRLVPYTEPLKTDSKGRPTIHYPYGRYAVGRDQLWLYSPFNRRSFDSRYFGPIPTESVKSVMLELWTKSPQ